MISQGPRSSPRDRSPDPRCVRSCRSWKISAFLLERALSFSSYTSPRCDAILSVLLHILAYLLSVWQAHATNEWPIGDNLITGRTVLQATNLEERLVEAENFVKVILNSSSSSSSSEHYHYIYNLDLPFLLALGCRRARGRRSIPQGIACSIFHGSIM